VQTYLHQTHFIRRPTSCRTWLERIFESFARQLLLCGYNAVLRFTKRTQCGVQFVL